MSASDTDRAIANLVFRDAAGGASVLAFAGGFAAVVADRLSPINRFAPLAMASFFGVALSYLLLARGRGLLALGAQLLSVSEHLGPLSAPTKQISGLARRSFGFFPRVTGSMLFWLCFMSWQTWDPKRTPALVLAGAALGFAPWLVVRGTIRREQREIVSLVKRNAKRIAEHANRPERWVHRIVFRNYHGVYIVLIVLWAIFAYSAKTLSAIAVSGVIALMFYAEVFLPSRVLNGLASPMLRRPRTSRGSQLLSQHAPWNFLINMTCAGAICFSLAETLRDHVALLIAAMIPAALLAYTFSVRGMVSILKWLCAGPTRIVVFRRYASEFATGHRSAVLPTLGAFGYLVDFEDATLSATSGGLFWDSQDALSGFFYQMPAGDPDWSDRIGFELDRADFAVFDWNTTPTPAMQMEFDLAMRALPSDRLIWLAPASETRVIRAWVVEHGVESPTLIDRDASKWRLAGEIRRASSSAAPARRWTTPELDMSQDTPTPPAALTAA
jgi:hypothetical protein